MTESIQREKEGEGPTSVCFPALLGLPSVAVNIVDHKQNGS